MAENSKIEWTDHTHNFWIGCTAISPACDFCYAEVYGHRFGVEWGVGKARRRTSEDNWKKPLAWNRRAEAHGTRYSVFSNSLSDWADTEVPDAWRDDSMKVIEATRGLDWLLLSKRPKVMLEYFKRYGSIPSNVSAGATVENRQMLAARGPYLSEINAQMRFFSMEPLLERVKLGHYLERRADGRTRVEWVIVGGESGPHARDMDPDWAREIRDECKVAGVPFFFKQMSRKAEIPADLLNAREFPK